MQHTTKYCQTAYRTEIMPPGGSPAPPEWNTPERSARLHVLFLSSFIYREVAQWMHHPGDLEPFGVLPNFRPQPIVKSDDTLMMSLKPGDPHDSVFFAMVKRDAEEVGIRCDIESFAVSESSEVRYTLTLTRDATYVFSHTANAPAICFADVAASLS